MDLETKTIVGFEGLIRWRHPDRGVLFPDTFLDVIELSGHITKFDRFVITEAIGFAARGHMVNVAVNVPGIALESSIVEFVNATAQSYKLEARHVTLELTEDPTRRKLDRINSVLAAFHELGFNISIDDFGTGESTFTRLINLPISEVKFDRSFVTNLLTNPALETIVKTTIQIAKELGLRCVAEGIEDEQTASKLVELGCFSGQGYAYSKPIPADDAIARLEHQHTWNDPLRWYRFGLEDLRCSLWVEERLDLWENVRNIQLSR